MPKSMAPDIDLGSRHKKVLANPEPSTHGPEAEVMRCPQFDRYQEKSGPDADVEFRQILTHPQRGQFKIFAMQIDRFALFRWS